MSLYAETSAVVAWILGQSPARRVADIVKSEEVIVTSSLTWVECDRAFRRLEAQSEEEELLTRLRKRLARLESEWAAYALDENCLQRARVLFPVEPIRSLDALHLATAVFVRTRIPDLKVLSLDARIRDNAAALGFEVLP